MTVGQRASAMRLAAALWTAGLASLPAMASANSMDGIVYVFLGPMALLTGGLQAIVVSGAAARLGVKQPDSDPAWTKVLAAAALFVPLVLAVITGAASFWCEYHFNHGRHKEMATLCMVPHVLMALVGVAIGAALLLRTRHHTTRRQ